MVNRAGAPRLKVLLALIAAAALGSIVAAQTPQELGSPRLRIEWDEFVKLYEAKAIVVVDVRGEAAFKDGHIPGAENVPLADVERQAERLKKLGKPIVTYCS